LKVSNRFYFKSGLGATIAAFAFAITSFAQQLPPLAQQLPPTSAGAGGSASGDALAEVVVTATKRDTTIQTTPLAITALSGVELQARGITDVASLVAEVPGVNMKSQGPGQTEFEMRGLTSSGGSSPTVGFYLDDTPITAPASSINGKVVIDPNLYDLNRIEVLRGPQGTLYGSSSMGGTIRLMTNQPNSEKFEASGQADLSDTDGGGFNHGENGMINIPLVTDKLALRIVASESQNSGWIDQIVVGNFPASPDGGATRGNVLAAPVIATNHGVNNADRAGFRTTLLYTPTEQLSITASTLYQQVRQGGENTFDSVPGTLAHYTPFGVPESFSDDFLTGGLTLVYRFSDFDVTSSTAQWSRTQKNSQDEAEALQWAFGLPSVYGSQGGIGAGNFDEQTVTKQTSEELRVTSTGDTRFQWILGGFYANFSSTENDLAFTPAAAALFGTGIQYSEFQPFKIDQKAAFGEASFKITNALKATVGLRYYSYNSTVNTAVSGYGSSTGSADVTRSTSQASAQGVNPKFNLSYQADDLLLYTTIAKGFRPGGANGPIPVTPTTALGSACLASLATLGKTSAPQTYAPDNVWSYEVGEKATFFDKRLTINTATYYEYWSGVAQTVSLSCGYYYYDNAGDAAVYGEEIEARGVLAPGLVWSGTAGYAHAALTKNVIETGGHKGDQLQDVAPWTASSSLSYTVPVRADWQANFRVAYDYVGPRIDATYNLKNQLPAYSLVNLRAGMSNNKWGVNLYVNNLTNKRAYLEDMYSLSVNLPSYNRIATNQPLTGGIGISYKFN
jgi:iron complex outermembrane recepter protein